MDLLKYYIALIFTISYVFADGTFPTLIIDSGVKVSSNEYYPFMNKKYPLYWAIDKDHNTAWVYEVEKQNIELTFTFPSPIEINELKIINGYAKNEYFYQANNKVTELSIITKDKKQNYLLKETLNAQSIKFSSKVSNLKLAVINISKGSKYNDTCISELNINSHGHNILSPIKSFISTSGGDYPTYTLYQKNSSIIMHFQPEQIVSAFYIENGKFAVFVHAGEMWMPGMTIINTETKKKFTVFKNLHILSHTLRWENGSFTGKAIDPKTDTEFSFKKSVKLKI